VWREWWKEILDTEPFPEVSVEPGPLTVLTRLPMNQTWPEFRLSPDGTRAILGVSRYEYLVDDTRSGIRLLDFDTPAENDFVYKVPIREVNAEPRGLAVA
jgi:hypothetical protein